MNNIETCIRFVSKKTHDQALGFEKNMPWRKNGLHVLQHGLRVKNIALDIIQKSNFTLEDISIENLCIAAILHDVGCVVSRENHGLKSIELTHDFLINLVSLERKAVIDELILKHSSKLDRDDNLLLNILKDADIIDEYGIQSLMMCSNWVNQETPFFFKELENRISEKEIAYGYDLLEVAYCDASKSIISKKIEMIRIIYEQLKYENAGSLDHETFNHYMV